MIRDCKSGFFETNSCLINVSWASGMFSLQGSMRKCGFSEWKIAQKLCVSYSTIEGITYTGYDSNISDFFHPYIG